VFDAMKSGAGQPLAAVSDVERLLGTVGDLPWQQAVAVGEGEEYRAESPQGDHASALVFEGSLIHGSVVPA
jgi:hypothetical protein